MSTAVSTTQGIGAVLETLRGEFPDITVSKIRFLEAEGLLSPTRTASGYRKFTSEDITRLRYILSCQRDHYLPLRVIKSNLSALDRGLEPAAAPKQQARVPKGAAANPQPADFAPTKAPLRISRKELLAESGLTEDTLASLESYGVVRPLAKSGSTAHYDADTLDVAFAVAKMTAFGIEARHIRQFKVAADREVGLVAQVIAPMAKGRDSAARERATEISQELAALSVQLHSALVRSGLESNDAR